MAIAVDELSRYEETSFWARQYGPYTPNPPLAGDLDVDVAVVGGGYTGLMTARELKRDNPGARVAVLEGTIVGWGASGRNGGFNMNLFGLEPEVTRWRWGDERMIASHRYARRAVAFVKQLIESEGLDSDYRHTGMFRVSYTDQQLRRLEKTWGLFQELRIDDDMAFWSGAQLREELTTDRYRGAIHERETGILDPCKHVRELKRIALAAGVEIYERTPVSRVEPLGGKVTVVTPTGRVRAEKVVLATNAYSRSIAGLPKLRSRQVPVWTFQVVTEPLSVAEWASIGWKNAQSLEDNRQLVHYFRPTVDGRITMGGGNITVPWSEHFDHDFAPRIWRHCERHLKWLFPQLAHVRIAYRWGGQGVELAAPAPRLVRRLARSPRPAGLGRHRRAQPAAQRRRQPLIHDFRGYPHDATKSGGGGVDDVGTSLAGRQHSLSRIIRGRVGVRAPSGHADRHDSRGDAMRER